MPGVSAPGATENDLALARQFFDRGPQSSAFALPPHLPAAEFARLAEVNGKSNSQLSDAWVREQQQQRHYTALADPKLQSPWAAEFGHALLLPTGSAPPQDLATHTDGPFSFHAVQTKADTAWVVLHRPNYLSPQMSYGNSMPMGMYVGQGLYPALATNFPAFTDQGKGKLREVELDTAFAQAAASIAPAQTESSDAARADSAVEDATAILQETTLNDVAEDSNLETFVILLSLKFLSLRVSMHEVCGLKRTWRSGKHYFISQWLPNVKIWIMITGQRCSKPGRTVLAILKPLTKKGFLF